MRTAGGFSIAAGAAVMLFGMDVPKFRTDIMQVVPLLPALPRNLYFFHASIDQELPF